MTTARRLVGHAEDIALNVLAIARELFADFRRSSRFFKYKAAIIAAWLVASVASIGLSCPPGVTHNSLGATLVVAGDASRPVLMIRNDGSELWSDVSVILNGRFRCATVPHLAPGRDLTLSLSDFADASQGHPPPGLPIDAVDLRTADGTAKLLSGGVVR